MKLSLVNAIYKSSLDEGLVLSSDTIEKLIEHSDIDFYETTTVRAPVVIEAIFRREGEMSKQNKIKTICIRIYRSGTIMILGAKSKPEAERLCGQVVDEIKKYSKKEDN